MAEISAEVRRQIGVLVDRQGVVAYVIVGDAKGLVIPALHRERGVKGRLKGLRLIHTHLDSSPLSHDDLMDLALLRLDAVAALSAAGGQPGAIKIATPAPTGERPELGCHQGPASGRPQSGIRYPHGFPGGGIFPPGPRRRGKKPGTGHPIGVTGANPPWPRIPWRNSRNWPAPPGSTWRIPSCSAGLASTPAFSWARASSRAWSSRPSSWESTAGV